VDCVSCGLLLDSDLDTCPGCGTSQAREAAGADEARCAVHPEVKASKACARCGAFLCVACDVDAGDLCRGCVAVRRQEREATTRTLLRRFTVVSLLHAPLMCSLAFLAGERAAGGLLAALGALEVAGVLLGLWRRRWFDLAMVMGGVASVICVWLVPSVPLMLLPLTLAAWGVVQILRLSKLEREAWLAEALLRRG